LNYKFH